MSLSLLRFLQSNETEIDTIDQKFLISGHSFLPNDSDFGSVELAAKGKSIYVPQQWYEIMASCRRKKKFIISQMSSDEILSTEPLEKCITRRKVNEQKVPVNWLKIQWLRVEKSCPFQIKYKETLQEIMTFETLDLTPSNRRRGRQILSLNAVPKETLYPSKRPVSTLKKRDMLDLIKFIPPVHHDFFLSLKTTENGNDDDIGPLPDYETQDIVLNE